LPVRRKVGTTVSAASWKRSEHALRCFLKLWSQITCRVGGIPVRVRFSSGASEASASQVAGGQDAIGDLKDASAGERVDGCPVGAVRTGVGSLVDGQVPVDGRGK
jgi:hypothetical protein